MLLNAASMLAQPLGAAHKAISARSRPCRHLGLQHSCGDVEQAGDVAPLLLQPKNISALERGRASDGEGGECSAMDKASDTRS
jgi:hypothetical protein